MRRIPFDIRIVVCNDYGLVVDFSTVLGLPIESWLTAAVLPALPKARRPNIDQVSTAQRDETC